MKHSKHATKGRRPVGTVTAQITDLDRPTVIGKKRLGRTLRVKIWYPASPQSAGKKAEKLWHELRSVKSVPLPMRILSRYASLRRSQSIPGQPLAPDLSQLPVVIYNHGIVSFASENQRLMEHLAQCGFVVLAIEHQDQFSEFQELTNAQPREKREADQAALQDIAAASGPKRAALSQVFYESAHKTNRIVSERARDTNFVVDQLDDLLDNIPAQVSRPTRHPELAFVGYSVGGAVSTEFGKFYSRTAAIVNIDGGIYGSEISRRPSAPYLMIYSSENAGVNDPILAEDTKTVIVPHTRHLNFHEVTSVLPWLRWLPATGKARPENVLLQRNEAILNFLQKHL